MIKQKTLDKIITFIFILFIGFSLGYGVRMHHEQKAFKSKNNQQIIEIINQMKWFINE